MSGQYALGTSDDKLSPRGVVLIEIHDKDDAVMRSGKAQHVRRRVANHRVAVIEEDRN